MTNHLESLESWLKGRPKWQQEAALLLPPPPPDEVEDDLKKLRDWRTEFVARAV